MKRCKNFRTRFPEYYYGELGQDDQNRIRTHLSRCPACRREYRKIRRLFDSLPRNVEPNPSPQRMNRMQNHVRRGIRQIEAESAGGRSRRVFPTRWASALASILIVLAVGVLSLHVLPSKEKPPSKFSPEEEWETAENMDLLKNMEVLEVLDVLEEILRQEDETENQGGDTP